jgi:two-component system sensor histidine kinase/response regulator
VAAFVEMFKITDQVKRQAEDLRLAHSELEKRVEQRTRELAVANQSLQVEIKERQRAEETLRDLNGKLEQRVADRTGELSAANQELETFSYSIAHDLRAPFRQISGYAEILREDFFSDLPPEAQGYLTRIGTRAKEMEKMVDDLLHLFVLVKQPFGCQEVDLGSIAKEVVSSLKGEAEGRSIEWHIGELPTLCCNHALIKQVFENVLSNAVKYTRPRNCARIEVGCERIDNEIVIYVRDNGVGFHMEDAGRLFGIFQRLHRAEEFEGAGVGLALVARIIRKHGGRVWAKGKPGKGATFYFTLGSSRREQ